MKNRRYSDLHQEDTLLGTFLHPLFHRLDPEAPALITKTQVKASVQKELSLMLNTRCVVSSFSSNPQGDEKGSELSSRAYVLPEGLGLTDFSFLKEGASSWPILARQLERHIALFDPRIKSPRIKILNVDSLKQEISMIISGAVSLGNRFESLCFPLLIGIIVQFFEIVVVECPCPKIGVSH